MSQALSPYQKFENVTLMTSVTYMTWILNKLHGCSNSQVLYVVQILKFERLKGLILKRLSSLKICFNLVKLHQNNFEIDQYHVNAGQSSLISSQSVT